MGKILFMILFAGVSWSASANGDDWRLKQNQRVKKATEQQRMEVPSSTAVGGSGSGSPEKKKAQDEQRHREAEEQKFFFEYENKYRRGM